MSRPKLFRNFLWGLDGTSQEMFVESGRVIDRGPAVSAHPDAEIVDLRGHYLLPSFVDAHCHILPTGLDLQKLSLATAGTKDEALSLVRDRHAEQPEGWLQAVGYDQNRYGEHITRGELDAISSTRPMLLRHVSGHSSVANSAALQAAGVDESAVDPEGGSYDRDALGHLTGLLLEDAHEQVTNSAPRPSLEEMAEAIMLAGEKMRAFGICCASDMMTGRFGLEDELQAYRIAAERGCAIETRLYLQWGTVFGRRALAPSRFRELAEELNGTGGRSRIGGIKIFADGAFGSATAAIYGEYSGAPPVGVRFTKHGHEVKHPERAVAGLLIYAPAKLAKMVQTAHDGGYQVAIHSIGDYATDLVMDAFRSTGEPSRHRIEHAMLLSDAQIERLASLDCRVTFQPEFLIRLAHAYWRQLGPERSPSLKRTRSVLDAGIRLGFSSDRPIVPGDPWDGIRAASKRPEGFDPDENCTLNEAIVAATETAALVNGDSDLGTLRPGARADFSLWESIPPRA